MGPPSFMRSVVDRHVVMRRMTVQKSRRHTYRGMPCVWPEPSICLHVRADRLRVLHDVSTIPVPTPGCKWDVVGRAYTPCIPRPWTNSWNRALLQRLIVTQLHKIPLSLYNPKFPCPVRKNPSLDLLLSHVNPRNLSHPIYFSISC